MSRDQWRGELVLLLQLMSVAAILGWLFDVLAWALLIASLIYIVLSFRQLIRIQKWLSHPDDSDPPEASGLWGDIFDGIYHLKRRERAEQSRLKDDADYFRDSLASLDDGALIVDKNGNIEWCNTAALYLLGLRFPEDVGQQVVNLVRSPSFIHYFENKDYSLPLEIVSPSHHDIHLQFQISFFGNGSRLLFARDITQNYRLQEMRKDFVGNVSHELRTPLTVLNGYLETFADSDLIAEPRWQRAVAQMIDQTHRMENLIKDLISLTRVESSQDVRENKSIAICPLLQMIRDEVLSVFNHEREINLDCDNELALKGNVEQLRSAFTNLILNAAKYSDASSVIDIKWSVEGDYAFLSVSDDGIGIASHHIPRLTERFYRVDKSRSTATGGTGLGLAIVKHILLNHHGDLQISSEVGVGSCFRCRFPLTVTEVIHLDKLA